MRQCAGGRRETHLSTQCPQAGPSTRLSPPYVDPLGTRHYPEPSPSRSGPVVRLIGRVTDRGSFVALRNPAKRVRRGVLRIAYVPDSSGRIRIAYALSRRVGNAVVRNRIRRRLRHAIMLIDEAGVIPPGTYLVSATPKAAEVPFDQLVSASRSLFGELEVFAASRIEDAS